MAANRTSASSKPTNNTNNTTPTKKTKKNKKPIQNESTHPQTPPNNQLNPSSSTPKRTKSPGVRVVGSRIYDSQNGKTCHQCRQKTMDFSVSCTYQADNKKQCPLNLCKACLSNRYGENAEEVKAMGDWKCPRCRGICNCSFCMKKRGAGPTGILVHTAKANGFDSVSSLLNMNGSTVASTVEGGIRKKRRVSAKETREPNGEPITEDAEVEHEKIANEGMSKAHSVEIRLSQGNELTNLAGVDIPSGDIGHALQLLEFCETFGEVLQLKKGESEILLRVLSCGNSYKTNEPLIGQLHIRLISIIEEDLQREYSRNSWVEGFKDCISESQYLSKESLLECFNLQPNGYDDLSFSKKLRLLNFLCDETLGTAKMRSWIDERNVAEKKKMKEKLIANREKEKNMKKKVQDEVAKAIISRNGAPLSISEHKDLISKVKAETAQTLANSLEMREVPRESYVVRSEPVFLHRNGCKLWKLRGQYEKVGILLQDSCYGDAITSDEKWFAYNDQDKALVNEYISTSRNIKE